MIIATQAQLAELAAGSAALSPVKGLAVLAVVIMAVAAIPALHQTATIAGMALAAARAMVLIGGGLLVIRARALRKA